LLKKNLRKEKLRRNKIEWENKCYIMTLYEFNSLDEQGKLEVVVGDSVYIATREDKEHMIRLYHTDDFYIELFYHFDEEALKKIRTFRNVSQLEPYLGNINIEELINGTNNK
jgi:hypothetical protein